MLGFYAGTLRWLGGTYLDFYSIQHFDSHGPSNSVQILKTNVVNQLRVYRGVIAYRPMTENWNKSVKRNHVIQLHIKLTKMKIKYHFIKFGLKIIEDWKHYFYLRHYLMEVNHAIIIYSYGNQGSWDAFPYQRYPKTCLN